MISGCVGPQGDGYDPEVQLSAEEAQEYHAAQIETFADTAADMVTAMTMTYVEEAIGIVRAAEAAGLPVVISFTVETNGRLPSGQSLGEAIEQTDVETGGYARLLHGELRAPDTLRTVVADGEPWTERIQALRANASTMSHAELDEAEELDDGDPADLGAPPRVASRGAPARERAGRLLRHRSPPRGGDQQRLALAVRPFPRGVPFAAPAWQAARCQAAAGSCWSAPRNQLAVCGA